MKQNEEAILGNKRGNERNKPIKESNQRWMKENEIWHSSGKVEQ